MTSKSGHRKVVKIRQLNVGRKILQCSSSQFIPEILAIKTLLTCLIMFFLLDQAQKF
jgi:hypothetical protein